MTDSNNLQNQFNDQPASNTPAKKAYHTPVIKQYGSLAELVQQRPHVGGDHGAFPDCTRS